MSDSAHGLPARASLPQLRKRAKDLLRALHRGDTDAIARAHAIIPSITDGAGAQRLALADAQLILAREHGFARWSALAQHVASLRPHAVESLERLAEEIATAYVSADATAIRELNWTRGTSLVHDRDAEAMRRHLRTWHASASRDPRLARNDARHLLARQFGAESWDELLDGLTPRDERVGGPNVVRRGAHAFFRVDERDGAIDIRRPVDGAEWDTIASVMRDRGLTALRANGQMTDDGLRRLAIVYEMTRLDLGGSTQLTDDGALQLAAFPRLEMLDISGWRSQLTDRSLGALGTLRALRVLTLNWVQRVSDVGIAALATCDRLERVDLYGTNIGDGAFRALAGKPALHTFKSGVRATDDGLAMLRDFPVFARWHGGESRYGLMSAEAGPNHLFIGGAFTEAGFVALESLGGLFALSIGTGGATVVPRNALATLAGLPRLGFLGYDGDLCDDEAMRHIASMPALRMLMAQGAVATDAGFASLATSRTLEYLWGRECPNLASRGFAALARSHSLRGLAVSLLNVDDDALALLPTFEALRELMPMDVTDAAFRHVGRCTRLEALWCMYCRTTGDAATAALGDLHALRSYYAGATQITDASLAMLSRLTSIERIQLWDCLGVTDAGLGALATMPNLRSLQIEGSPGITRARIETLPSRIERLRA